mmetsp:Transcript_24504/g.43959  ORF Transcript_24504/g.43959 Transcript_24504/m.43959 type:complete len:632 (+) Transcript_24504:45-1940(+)|eukprot:CAMPEP_0201909650 /NCGR_PEP_ID=MMETSP0903-20130614/1329_1 /ASSEMBLY_ACC=CAM_ASM_000552 /TAXON_ID=420261 /ORGANISM="Thalassiosira antarctica, Strain CCMP982" /LENGTH=631 /DNA_ID=CAMNT_0048444191 /DNA_START=39 /DNA_END=1934 /DNA_ORIENTATION=-
MPFFCPNGGPLQNPYQLLNIEHGATDDEIAKSFKKLMLQLHPDKQPAGQSAEEAEQMSQKFHDVKDAKSFLIDGEHLAARRSYDSKLVRAKQQAKLSFGLASNNVASMPQQQAAATASGAAAVSKKKGNPDLFTSKNKNSDVVKKNGGSKQPNEAKSDFKVKTTSSKKNVNVKQWGKVNRPKNRPVTRRASERERVGDPMKNKTHTRAGFKGLDDSCGDCSTTDDYSSPSDDERKRRHTYSNTTASDANNRPSSNRPSVLKGARHKVAPKCESTANNGSSNKRNSCQPNKTGAARERSNSDIGTGPDDTNRRKELGKMKSSNLNRSEKPKSGHDTNRRTELGNRRSYTDLNKSDKQKSGYKPADAGKNADFSTFYPAVDSLEEQYHCPLTKEIMTEPMSDFEGNSYERIAILKYLGTHSTSPVTGNPLFVMHLTPNSAMKEKIRYTLKLKDCIDSLQNATQHAPPLPPAKQQSREAKYKSLREAVDNFIKDLNSGSPAVTIAQLDSSGTTSFSYLGLKFRLDVPEGVSDNIIVQTWYEHSKKAAGISGRVVQFNASLQKIGLGGRLTFRNMNRKHAFMLTKKMDPEKFSKTELRHGIEYFMEMSIKLHNIINTTDVRRVDKIRLTNSIAAG